MFILQGLKLLAPVVRKLGPNANPAKLKEVPVQSLLVWAFYAGITLKGHYNSKKLNTLNAATT